MCRHVCRWGQVLEILHRGGPIAIGGGVATLSLRVSIVAAAGHGFNALDLAKVDISAITISAMAIQAITI